ncbi:probable disease resistance protein At4g27220 [Daucus carota subsp. sativus]|uniref:probable disease resistance protein At4g27220 n=1 Tax=Daucus carota subsp. sativus TaxID=79200 RepID=UPI0007EFEFB1|nr:PREDICTED: probable disease resistance protein At4g27220 [Daucus carota subsp. sativus]XP_017229696.1 PREDICTED: probable disease resistance protein At4g27220 [Daucus carota subsp. sativus]XP_017229697.1 PREDICTED: probable disease resistance protein At4g27220 [Daucus carota subsp. sativus]XP_017229698.1 PREDICTED: probable disease resistance protein At4g27220 [Daucus carota subsp. sativus]XP_017229699.1 PREDICTED: probable disease resistance protein At4g27220 [Daucus carota subsp. sativus]
MVGLSDIPCVGKNVDRISDAAVDALFRGFSYMFSYKNHVQVLETEIQKLDAEMDRMSRKVREEKDNGKMIVDGVSTWQADVEEVKKSAEEILEKYKNRSSWRCIQWMPIPKPVSRSRLGREAAHKAKRVIELSDSANNLLANGIAYGSPAENAPNTVYQTFKSRSDAYDKLWKALVSEGGSTVLGIYGMPGVGKTTMMESLWKEALEKKIFDKVTRADVGNEDLDVFKLQKQIADHLDCHLNPEDDEQHRASQLKKRLTNGEKILIILDDVWKEIPLHRIGISLGDGDSSTHRKILLTSRKKRVCMDNKCLHPVKIAPLGPEEAWQMFRNTVVPDNIYLLPDESLALEVCNQCGGLPLLIHAVGKALQFTSPDVWKDALNQLVMGNFEKIADIDSNVYACVKLSFDRLPDDAKSCLVLCSLYPEDASIYINKLIPLATGSRLVRGGEARIRSMVEILRSSSLLLDSEDHIIKVHDLIRDVARSIAVKDPKYSFSLVRCGSLLPDDVDYHTRKFLRLHLEKNDILFPDGLVCQDLHNLWLQCNKHAQQFLGDFFGMFVNLRFLLIEDMLFSLEPQFSLRPLVNLRTLILDGCEITHVSQTNASFFPENLVALYIWNCDLPRPLNLPILKHLRKLEIQGWRSNNIQMVPNTVSSMPSLQELHIPGGYKIQDDGCGKSLDAVSAPILGEISKLTGLKSLQMFFFSNSEHFQDTNIFGNLLQYNISVGAKPHDRPLIESSVSIKRLIELQGSGLESLKGLIERAEEVSLDCTDIHVGSIYNSNREAFTDLKNLYIRNCNTIEYLARISCGEIQHSRSFANLGVLEIKDCSALKYLFSKSVAKCLVQLQELAIVRCPVMEAILMNEGTSDRDGVISFCKLKFLSIYNIPRLKSFCMQNKDLHSGSTTHNSAISNIQAQPLFDKTVAFPSLEVLTLEGSGDTVYDIWGNSEYDKVGSSFHKLKIISLYWCKKLERVIPLAMSNNLRNLESLTVWNCPGLKNVFQHSSVARDLIHLKKIEIYHCHRLRNVFQHSSMVRDLINLQKLNISHCEMMRVIIDGKEEEEDEAGGEEEEEEAGEEEEEEEEEAGEEKEEAGEEEEEEITDDKHVTIVFPKLTTLHLDGLQCLTSFLCYRSGEANPKIQFPYLVDFKLNHCGSFNYDVMELCGDDSNCKLRTIEMTYHRKIQLSSKWYSRLYNLESLTLIHYHWWPQLKFQCFKRLKVLKVEKSGCSTLFSFSAFESLGLLQKLEIKGCALLEDIVEDVRSEKHCGTNKRTVTLSRLISVSLKNLPNLKSFFHSGNYECHMPALEVVQVDNCGISTLFTCSVFRTVHQLKELKVYNCELLEDIVEATRGAEPLNTDDRLITTPQLSVVALKDCPNLKNFSSNSSYAFNMPNLSIFFVIGCPQIEYFTSLKTTTPLVSVYSDWHKWVRSPDLNDYIRENCKRKDDSSSSAGEVSNSNQEPETDPVMFGEQQLQETEENAQQQQSSQEHMGSPVVLH